MDSSCGVMQKQPLFPEVLQVRQNPITGWWMSSWVTKCSQRPPWVLPVGPTPPEPLQDARLDGWSGCNTLANVTSCQPLNRGAVSGGCRQAVPCQAGPLVWEWRLSGDWLSLIIQRERAIEESVACQLWTSSSQTSDFCAACTAGLSSCVTCTFLTV